MQSQASCCPICYCEFDQSLHLPRLIPSCGHTFCSECLSTLIKNPNENKCPLDKTIFAHQMFVHDFPINFALKQLIEERCSLEICPDHKEEMRMICLTDKTKICEDCLYYGHNGHTIKPMKIIKGEADMKRREIETVLEKLDSYNKEVNGVLEEKRMQLLKVIKDRFTQLKWLLTKQEKEMTFEITSFFNYERNKMNKVIGVNSELRKNLARKIASLKNIFHSNTLFKELEEDVSKITSNVNQILTEKPINILRQELREMTAPLDSFFGEQTDLISQIVFSHDLAEKMSLTNTIFPDEPTTPKTGSSYSDSMAKGLFSIESKDNVIIASSRNVLSEGKYHGDSVLVGPNDWKNSERVNLKLCETDSPEEHAQTLFYIWRKIDKPTSLKIDFTPDFIYFGDFNTSSDVNFDNYLVTLFPALFWKTQNLQKLELNMMNCRFGDEAITLLSKEVLSKLSNLKSLTLNMNSTDITNKSLEGIAKYAFPSLKDLEELHIDLSKTTITTQGVIQLFIPKETLKRYTLKLSRTKIDNVCIKTFAQKMATTLENLEDIELDLGHTSVSDEALSYIFVSYHNVKSFRLALNDTKISTRTLETFADYTLSNTKNLQTLEINLCNTFVGDNGMTKLVEKIPQIKHLSFILDNTTITDETLTALVESVNVKFEDLESLKLSLKCTIVTDAGVSKLFGNMASMKSFVLNLGETEISDLSVKAFVKNSLCEMKKLENLELYFYETSVTDDSLIELFAHIKEVKRFVIDVRSTGVSDKSIYELLWNVIPEMKLLEDLEIHTHNTKVSAECAAEIEEIKERFIK